MINLLILVTVIHSSLSSIELPQILIGKWEYRYSIINDVQTKFNTNVHCPVEKMVFSKCSDKMELFKMPKNIRDRRLKSVFKNICCETFNNNIKIDRYYPIENKLIIKSDTIYGITNYGYKYKSEYYINRIKEDSLIISDDNNFNLSSQTISVIRHYYIRIN